LALSGETPSSFVGVSFNSSDLLLGVEIESLRFRWLALFLTRRMYSPSRMDEPPLNPYDFVRTSESSLPTPNVWNDENEEDVGSGE
jgi:hypothetical protein